MTQAEAKAQYLQAIRQRTRIIRDGYAAIVSGRSRSAQGLRRIKKLDDILDALTPLVYPDMPRYRDHT